MRALITFAFVLFLVVSVPLLLFAAVFTGVFAVALWCCALFPIVGALCVVWLHDERPRFLPSDILFPPKRKYRDWNSINGWPRSDTLFYECGMCHVALPSQTKRARECSCGNLFITADNIGAQNPAKVLLFEDDFAEGAF